MDQAQHLREEILTKRTHAVSLVTDIINEGETLIDTIERIVRTTGMNKEKVLEVLNEQIEKRRSEKYIH